MLKIRLSRTGKKSQPSFRVVLAEHTNAVKGKYKEVLGHYVPSVDPKIFEFNKERIEYWISKGAQPSDTVASLLKRAGMPKMEKFIAPRNKKRKKKKGGDEPEEKAEAPKEEAKSE